MAFKSNFQRSQSKVWWASNPERDEYGFVALPKATTSLTHTNISPIATGCSNKPPGNKLSPPEITTTSWSYRRGSPGSFKSHDSGFSDSDQQPSPPSASSLTAAQQSNTSGSSGHSSLGNSPNTPKRRQRLGAANLSDTSASSSTERCTPPTVIRRTGILAGVLTTSAAGSDQTAALSCRRISFSAPSSPIYERIDADLHSQIASSQCANNSASSKDDCSWESSIEERGPRTDRKFHSLKRCKVIRRANRTDRTLLLRCVSQISIESDTDDCYAKSSPTLPASRVPDAGCTTAVEDLDEPAMMMQTAIPQTPRRSTRGYHNETVVFGAGAETAATPADSELNQTQHILPTYAELYPNRTSTPKATGPANKSTPLVELAPTLAWNDYTYTEYSNPLLNGHSSSIQHWLDITRRCYAHEVLATLQTKSIAAQAARYSDLTSAMAGRLIRQLQQRSARLQTDFEYVERLLADAVDDEALLKELPAQLQVLHANVVRCTQNVATGVIFAPATGTDCGPTGAAELRAQLASFHNTVACVAELSHDLLRSADDLGAAEPPTLLDDVQLLKRYVLITVRQLLERLVRVICDRIESTDCQLILRSNIALIAELSNAAHSGFASLDEALLANRTAHVLLTQCTEPRVRLLALRALTTVACSPAAIAQFQQCGGLEIVSDLLTADGEDCDQQELELVRREALSVLAQVTAHWHGAQHRVHGLRQMAEQLVAALTRLAERTRCCQTRLLAVATLANLARLEAAAVYSLMSNETVVRLGRMLAASGAGVSVFLHEQLVQMIAHMAANKRCQAHLNQKPILTLLTAIYHRQCAARYQLAAEQAAQLRVSRTVLDIFGQLVRHCTLANRDVSAEQNAMVALLHGRVRERLQRAGADEQQLSASAQRMVAEITTMLDGGQSRVGRELVRGQVLGQEGQQQQQQLRGSTRSADESRRTMLLESYV